jgi:hypothetical protein
MATILEIKGHKYPIKFGYGAFRLLGNAWDCKGIQGVALKFQSIFPEGGSEEVTFEQGDMLGDLALAGIEVGSYDMVREDDIPARDDVVQELLFNADKISILLAAFSESFPKPETSGNAEPRSKARKSATKKK